LYAQIDSTIYTKLGVTKKTLDNIYNNWVSYSDGYLLGTIWQWKTTELNSGETKGMCIGQYSDPPSYLSCWSVMRQVNGTKYESNHSYLVSPTTFATLNTTSANGWVLLQNS
jgi:hypothetical protein